MRILGTLAVAVLAGLLGACPADAGQRSSSGSCNWCGPYFGAYAGAGFADPTVNFGGFAPGLDSTEFTYGGYAGVSAVRGAIVWGAEADFGGYGGAKDGKSEPGDTDIDFRWVGLLRSRFGYLLSDSMLAYATAGLAMTEVRVFEQSSGGLAGKETLLGYTLGAGLEAQIDDAWHARIDYAFVEFSKEKLTGIGGFVDQTVEAQMHLVHFGVSRQFSWGE